MAKKLLLYTPIWDDIAAEYIKEFEEDTEQDIDIRVNTPGGSVFAGNGMIAVTSEHVGRVMMKVDGSAASMGAFLLYYADYVEANDMSRIMIHRADGWVETPEEQALLDGINSDLKAQMKKRLNGPKFKAVTGYTIDQIFDPKQRIEVWINAKEAKKIGLVDKVNRLKPREQTAMGRMVAQSGLAEQLDGPAEGKQHRQTPEAVDLSRVSQAITINKSI